MKYVTVSAKIRRDTYEKLKTYNISISKVIREALEREIERRKNKKTFRGGWKNTWKGS